MARLLRAAMILAFIFSANSAFAAVQGPQNWYVLKGATGSNNGTSWTSAWNEMNQVNFSTVACGDTIWLAGGTYTTTLTINKTCTAGNVLLINRVLSTDSVPVAAAGWNSAFDSQVIIGDAGITLSGGAYFTVDGRTGSAVGPTINLTFGISVQCTVSTGCGGIGGPGGGGGALLDHVTFTHVEVIGPACILVGGGASGACTGTTDGFNIVGSNVKTFLLLDHMWIHRWAEAVRTSSWNNCTIQYTDIDTTNPTAGRAEHEDIMYNSGANNNFTMRYNRIWGSPNDGIFFDFGGTTNFQFYGNYYYHSGAALMTFKAGYSFGTVFIYNNVFENDGTYGDVQPGNVNFNGSMAAGGAVENNVFENINLNGASQITSADYNAYSTSVGKDDTGTHSFTYNPGTIGASVMLVNEAPSNPLSADFHLTSTGATTFQNGVTLSSPFNVDPDGNTRGANGHSYIGAYQYLGSQSQAPQPPTGLVATVQ
jgi:hypothetical protein